MSDNRDKIISFLLEYCSKYPETYNKVSNELWHRFKIADAGTSLLCTYILNELCDEVKHK